MNAEDAEGAEGHREDYLEKQRMPIYPQVRLAACAGPGSAEFAHRPWLDGHIIAIVEGDEAGWRFLTEPDLEARGGFDAAMEEALRNLDELAQRPGVIQAFRNATGQVACILTENSYFVSGLLLQPRFVAFCRAHLGDDFSLCVPGADEFIAFRNPDLNNSGATALESFRVHEHPVSPHIYGSDGGEGLRVQQQRQYDPQRLVLSTLEVRLAAPGTIVEKTPDSAWGSGQRAEPLSPEAAAAIEEYRKVGAALIHSYQTAPDGRLSPRVLDATLQAWRNDRRPERCDEPTIASGLGVLLGDLYCAMLSGEWVTFHDSAGASIAVRTNSGAISHPIDSIAKRTSAPSGSIEELCRQFLESEGAI